VSRAFLRGESIASSWLRVSTKISTSFARRDVFAEASNCLTGDVRRLVDASRAGGGVGWGFRSFINGSELPLRWAR